MWCAMAMSCISASMCDSVAEIAQKPANLRFLYPINAASIAPSADLTGIRHLMRLARISIEAALRIAFCLVLTGVTGAGHAQGLRTDLDLGSQWRVNSTVRLMAGLQPWHPSHLEFAKTDAWKDHSAAIDRKSHV